MGGTFKACDLQAGCDLDDDPGNAVYCEGYPSQWIEACYTAMRRYYSHRSVEIWDIFTTVFGGTERLVRVMASQAGRPWLHGEYLTWEDAWRKTDALATAPYFGGSYGGDPAVASWTLKQLLDDIEHQELPTVFGKMSDTASFLAANYPQIAFIAYEGGQHLAGLSGLENDPQMNALFDAANRDPRMGALYTAYLDGWRQRGGQLFVHFVNVAQWSKWGRWGALEYQDQPANASPKYQALMGFIDANPCWWPCDGGESCVPGPSTMCLSGARFRVEVRWTDFEGGFGAGQVVPVGSHNSGLFWFFDANNWEMLVKVLDGCGVNERYWVFSAATTNVGYTLRVTDTQSGQVREYTNPLGVSAPAITDTAAFATCP